MAQISYREALRQALGEELERDERVFIMGAEVGYFGGGFRVSDGLLATYGDRRVRDMPNSAAAIVGAGIGAALGGLKPVIELTSRDANALAISSMLAMAAGSRPRAQGRAKVPIVIRVTILRGDETDALDAQSVEGFFVNSDTVRVAAPATPADAKGLLKSAIRGDQPVIFVEHESLYDAVGEVPGDRDLILPFGKANVLREGADLTIVTYSRCVHEAIGAAEMLAKDGIEAELIDLRTLNPLDMTTVVESVKRTRRAMVVCSARPGHADAEIAAQIYRGAYDSLAAPVERVRSAEIVECARRLL
ncbi:MAG: transketolase C-terminal domain-containing protein [Candidatus Binatus sp.]|uniref:alpha-ketoacid dehydrogenase subunit beta n=1 Tax=Candidatus Binatus sp. TaxID=2811406 RepID=UPI0027169004|nr:transketolase C-terminal domain-containing protein [Candidatus Binatus sp.]MDO8434562.1 transketolase C-terminal domain-containing protein [Candidatus Binatus sp.]